jgi:hypothetical protein
MLRSEVLLLHGAKLMSEEGKSYVFFNTSMVPF